ncbi:CBS domain-containing protein [Candidatus Woesearchaeota archaeon]|nr:CBS domain-containing protein [Candidatus Woesearchaeota archaeon]
MKIREIMTSIKKTSADTTVSDAAKLMDAKIIGGLLIEEEGKVIGIVTERDVLRKIVAKGRDPTTTLVKDIMSTPLITIDPEKSLEEANEIMAQKNIRRLPVESNGSIVGMITIRDISDNLRYTLGKSLLKHRENDFVRNHF